MKSLCIKTNNSDLLDYLLNELKNLDLDNVCFSTNEFKHYKNIIVHYYSEKDEVSFFSKISSILSFLVMDELEEDLLRKILLHNYFYFDSNERNQILEICFDINSEDFSSIFDKKFDCLYNCFFDFISTHKSIVLNGFINFRINEYINILNDIINEAVNHFIIEKEYMEFISLLRLYINSQACTCNTVHMIYSVSDSILLDEHKNIISASTDIFKAKYLSDISFSANDYTLNSLLTLLPKNIYIHLIDGYIDEFVNTIQLVFENRVHLCTDCNICKIYKQSWQSIKK